MRTARALLVAAALAATLPTAGANASTCSPQFRDVCDTVCAHTSTVCRLFG